MINLLNKFKLIAFLSAFLLFGIGIRYSFAQKNVKPDIYILFRENDSLGMQKYTYIQSEVISKSTRNKAKNIYDVYGFQLKETREKNRFKFATININNFCTRDSDFVKKNAKELHKIKDTKGFSFDSTDTKRFPFNRVFIVEYINENLYKVIQVNTYVGSDQ